MFPFLELKGLNSYFKFDDVRIDHLVFRLHCIFTSVVLIATSILLTSSQLIGAPISCFTSDNHKGDFLKALNDYCWTSATYSMPDQFDKTVGEEVIYPGLGFQGKNPKRLYHAYYQWVCFVFFLQSLFCYLPKAIWDYQEGGLISHLTTGLNGVCQGDKEEKKKSLVSYLLKYRQMHKTYAFSYWGCELLCLVNVLVQMWMMDVFLGGQFWTYGHKVVQHSQRPQEERVDPMIFIFPRLTECNFQTFGYGGGRQETNALCVLPLNNVNEKVYIFLWFWFVILAIALTFVILSRLLVILSPSVRPRLLNARARSVALTSADIVSRRSHVGDWWLLYLLAKNINPVIYRDIIADLAKRIIEREIPHSVDCKPRFGCEKRLID